MGSGRSITVGKAAELLGVTPVTVRQMISRGELRAWRIGGGAGHYRIEFQAIREYIASRTVTPEPVQSWPGRTR